MSLEAKLRWKHYIKKKGKNRRIGYLLQKVLLVIEKKLLISTIKYLNRNGCMAVNSKTAAKI